jgi:hypothetical protein
VRWFRILELYFTYFLELVVPGWKRVRMVKGKFRYGGVMGENYLNSRTKRDKRD